VLRNCPGSGGHFRANHQIEFTPTQNKADFLAAYLKAQFDEISFPGFTDGRATLIHETNHMLYTLGTAYPFLYNQAIYDVFKYDRRYPPEVFFQFWKDNLSNDRFNSSLLKTYWPECMEKISEINSPEDLNGTMHCLINEIEARFAQYRLLIQKEKKIIKKLDNFKHYLGELDLINQKK
jgi:hypothetical protein